MSVSADMQEKIRGIGCVTRALVRARDSRSLALRLVFSRGIICMSEQHERERERESSLSYFANDLFREEGRKEGRKEGGEREEDKADLERSLALRSVGRAKYHH